MSLIEATQKRTLILTTSWPHAHAPMAGTFVYTDVLIRSQNKEKICVLVPHEAGTPLRIPQIELKEFFHCNLFGFPGTEIRIQKNPIRMVGLFHYTHSIAQALREFQPTHILAHWWVPSGLLAAVCASSGLFIEIIAHGADIRILEKLPRLIARYLIEQLAHRVQSMRVVSNSLAERIVRITPSVAKQLVVKPMPLAIEIPEVFNDVQQRALQVRTQFQNPFYVVACRLIASKRVERAIYFMKKKQGTLLLIGDGPERASLIKIAAHENIVMHSMGALPHYETLAWIAAADCLLAPLAHGEGAPTVVREARALNIPVVEFV